MRVVSNNAATILILVNMILEYSFNGGNDFWYLVFREVDI